MKILKWHLRKFLIFCVGSKLAQKLPQGTRYDRESQNCYWVLFTVTRVLILRTSYPELGGFGLIFITFGSSVIFQNGDSQIFSAKIIIFKWISGPLFLIFRHFRSEKGHFGVISPSR